MSSQAQTVPTVSDVRAVVKTRVPQRPFKGLCVSCDDRFVCTFQRPEGGVFFCEEYR